MKYRLLSSVLLIASTITQANTTIDLISENGDYIGQGNTYHYNDDNAHITYKRNYDNGITVRINNLPDGESLNWALDLSAPNNDQLKTGIYDNAERFPFQNSENSGLSFSGQGRGCNTLSGKFEIFDVTYADDGEITALNASFEQYCEASASALKGHINFNTIDPVGVTANGLSPIQVVCKNRTTGQRVIQQISSLSIDCRKSGLEVNTGDEIQIRIRGLAQ